MIDKLAALLMDVGVKFPKSSAKYLMDHNVIVIPCKPGDTVYRVKTDYKTREQYAVPEKVKRLDIDVDGVRIVCEGSKYPVGLGHLVFLSEEAAERAMRGKKHG